VPELGPWQTADLAADRPWAQEHSHGVSLEAAVTESADWLSAAVLAGYVPPLAAIELALCSYQQFCLSKGGYLEAIGDSLVGPAWVARIDYPRMIDLLKEQIAELEDRFGDPDQILSDANDVDVDVADDDGIDE
jgi:hypothetical protein